MHISYPVSYIWEFLLIVSDACSFFTEPAAGSSQQVDLFGDSLIGDLLDTPAPVPPQSSAVDNLSSEDNLFADADFVSAAPKVETGKSSRTQVRCLLIVPKFLSLKYLLVFGDEKGSPSAVRICESQKTHLPYLLFAFNCSNRFYSDPAIPMLGR